MASELGTRGMWKDAIGPTVDDEISRKCFDGTIGFEVACLFSVHACWSSSGRLLDLQSHAF